MALNDSIARFLRGGPAAALELACLFAAGAAAAAVGWALLDPVGHAPSAAAFAPSGNVGLSVSQRRDIVLAGGDPFLRATSGASRSGTATSGYVLHATLSSPDGEGSAIISAPGLPQASYAVGDTIGGRARLVAVGPDHIEIDDGGARQRIAFASSGGPLLQAAPLAPQMNPVAAPDRSALMTAMTLRPVERSGGTIGMEIVPRNAAVLRAAGLNPGDVIVAVNGAPLTPETLAQRQGDIISGAAIQLRIERAGAQHTLNLGSVAP